MSSLNAAIILDRGIPDPCENKAMFRSAATA